VLRAAAGLLLGACFALMAGRAEAYELLGADWSYMRHPMGEPWQVCAAGMPAGADRVIKRAAAVWGYARFRFTFRADGCSPDGPFRRSDGVNRIDFGGLGGRTLAQTETFYVPSKGDVVECNLRFNARVPWYVGVGRVPAGRFDLFSAALHEFGHCLGLLHSRARPTPVMYPVLARGDARRRLEPDDRAGERAIYSR
jgi:hypothetical protein